MTQRPYGLAWLLVMSVAFVSPSNTQAASQEGYEQLVARQEVSDRLFKQAFEKFSQRYRIAAMLDACERKGIGRQVLPTKVEAVEYIVQQTTNEMAAKWSSHELIVLADSVERQLFGYYLGHLEAARSLSEKKR